jgi:deoxyadenosine/deoxycytidine kinase
MFFLEGNVGTGKSTFLKKLQEITDIHVILEPVDEWVSTQNLNSGKNLLEEFYANQERWAYTFQSIAFRTRINNLLQAPKDKINIIERSVFTDRNVFAKTCYENSKMCDIEWNDYTSWFDWLTDTFDVKPKGYIYLRADPEVSYDRVKIRNRGGEESIPLDYLKTLHDKHDEWLLKEKNVLVLDVNEDFEKNPDKLSEMIQKVLMFIKK